MNMDHNKFQINKKLSASEIKEFLVEAEGHIKSKDRLYLDEIRSNNTNPYLKYSLSGLLINIGVLENDESMVNEGITIILDNMKLFSKQKEFASGAYYNLANGFNALFNFKKRKDIFYVLFNKTELEQAKINYLKAIQTNPQPKSLLASQIWVNLGNLYFDIGRVIDALDCYNAAISCDPNHGMAYVNKGKALYYFARYSGKQRAPFAKEAYRLIKHGIELGINEEPVCYFKRQLTLIEGHFKTKEWLNKERASNQIKIRAKNKFERFLIEYCLKNKLYLNICSFCQRCDQAIGDPETIEKMIEPIKKLEGISNSQMSYLFSYINQIKQDYIAARFILILSQYRGLKINFVDKKVRLIDTLDYQVHNIRLELLRNSFVSFYNILDKIACFIKEYLELNKTSEKNIYFSDVWYKELRSENGVHDKILDTKNIFLNALFNIHGDIEKGPQQKLKGIRHRLTHAFLRIYWMAGMKDKRMTERGLYDDTLFLSKIVRNAVIYLLKFVYIEETKKENSVNKISIPMPLMEIPDKLKDFS